MPYYSLTIGVKGHIDIQTFLLLALWIYMFKCYCLFFKLKEMMYYGKENGRKTHEQE